MNIGNAFIVFDDRDFYEPVDHGGFVQFLTDEGVETLYDDADGHLKTLLEEDDYGSCLEGEISIERLLSVLATHIQARKLASKGDTEALVELFQSGEGA